MKFKNVRRPVRAKRADIVVSSPPKKFPCLANPKIVSVIVFFSVQC